MYEDYKDQVEFFLVYIREAHPTDGWQSRANELQNILVKQPTKYVERVAVATEMCTKLDLKMPPLIDNLDDKVNKAYSAEPDRLYLVGIDGKIAFKGARGPRGFKPAELEQAIIEATGSQ
jgi:hypothetical protein